MTDKERNELIKQIYETNGLIEKLYNDVIAEENKRKIAAGNLKLGQKILIKDEDGEETWTAIAYDNGNVAILLDKEYEIKQIKFGDNNNYIESNARKVATTCDPVKRIQKVLGRNAFIPLEIDLFSHDGLRDYGVCRGDLAGIIPYDMYRNNREYIEPSYMLLSTPDSTPSGFSSDYVCYVDSGGDVSCHDCDWDGSGVRPFCILKSSIFVSLFEE